eukprot:CAMPEP_0174275230 /NCGR_PEP_ID=MMETSP0439-20130205/59711_1 /TAXON_ID=0 /ORGANISM="Stereomyxa ramosa, Strain Chinc5" /LENGTH=178 /DNA_ID=CAMNT_0015367315 /DNA_START=1026 /DNA_END=1558 /DNA_ORIENTATION=+
MREPTYEQKKLDESLKSLFQTIFVSKPRHPGVPMQVKFHVDNTTSSGIIVGISTFNNLIGRLHKQEFVSQVSLYNPDPEDKSKKFSTRMWMQQQYVIGWQDNEWGMGGTSGSLYHNGKIKKTNFSEYGYSPVACDVMPLKTGDIVMVSLDAENKLSFSVNNIDLGVAAENVGCDGPVV